MRPELCRVGGACTPEHERVEMDRRTTLSDIEDLARRLCYETDPSSVWAAEDEVTRLYYRRQAQQRYAAERYTETEKVL